MNFQMILISSSQYKCEISVLVVWSKDSVYFKSLMTVVISKGGYRSNIVDRYRVVHRQNNK